MRVYSRGVVEYDAEGFTKLTLLLMWKDFCFLVHGRKINHVKQNMYENIMIYKHL